MIVDENILKVEQFFQQNPTTSIRRAAQILNIKREILRIIARHFANFFPYKIQINQALKPETMEQRKLFSQMLTSAIEAKDLTLSGRMLPFGNILSITSQNFT